MFFWGAGDKGKPKGKEKRTAFGGSPEKMTPVLETIMDAGGFGAEFCSRNARVSAGLECCRRIGVVSHRWGGFLLEDKPPRQ